jgi:hypothetical protein
MEVTSPVDGATTVFLLLPKMTERRFRPLGGRARPEVKSPFDSLTPIWFRSALEFFNYLLPVQSYLTFPKFF